MTAVPSLISADVHRALELACRELGLSTPHALPPGRWVPCDVLARGVRGRGDGRVLLTADGLALIAKNWTTSETRTIFIGDRPRRPALAVVRTSEHDDAAKRAQATWLSARPAEEHPYLLAKRVQSHGARVFGDALVIPALDENGEIATLQFIQPDGSKKFLAGGRTKGCYYPIGEFGESPDLIYIAEGFATAATVHEASGAPVAVAFNAGNLAPVAEILHRKYPSARLIIAGDDDAFGPRNAGVESALQAAQAVGGSVVLPVWHGERPQKSTDFNDLAIDEGLERVRECINSIVPSQHVASAAAGEAEDQDEGAGESEKIMHEARGRLLPDIGRYMKPYPVHALGPLAAVAREIAEGKQLSIPIAGNALLAAASLLVSPHWRVRTIDGETLPLSLYALTAAISGAGKDTAESIVLRPIVEWQEKANTEYQKAREAYAARQEELKRERRKQKHSFGVNSAPDGLDEPEPPRAPHRFCKDMTVEGLRQSFVSGAPAQGVFTTEAASILLGHGFTPEQRAKTSAVISDLYSSGTLSVLRAGGGRFEKYGLRLVMHLASQPDIIGEVLRDPKMAASGLWPRFLLAWPELPPERKHKKWVAAQSRIVREYWQRCMQLLELPMPENCNSGLVIELSPEAEAALGAYFEDLEIRASVRRGGELVPVRPFAVRATEQATRIAGVLAAWRGAGVVSLDDALGGIELADYSLNCWKHAKDPYTEDADVAAALELLEWLTARPGMRASARDMLRSAPRRLRKACVRDAAIARLKLAGFIREVNGEFEAVMPAEEFASAAPASAVEVAAEEAASANEAEVGGVAALVETKDEPAGEEIIEIEIDAPAAAAVVEAGAKAETRRGVQAMNANTNITEALDSMPIEKRRLFEQLIAAAEDLDLPPAARENAAQQALDMLARAEAALPPLREPGSDDDWSEDSSDSLDAYLPPRPDWWVRAN